MTETPRARFVRTFLTLLAAAAVTWKAIDWQADYRTGIAVVAWSLVSIFIASAIAYAVAAKGLLAVSSSPLARAGATFLEQVLGALPVVVITSLADLVAFERILASTLGIAIAGAIGALALNAANPLTPTPEPPAG